MKYHGSFKRIGINLDVKHIMGNGKPEGLGSQEHSHDFVELVIVSGGKGIHRVEGYDYPVIAGNVFVVAENQTHAIMHMDNMEIWEIPFNPHFLALPKKFLKKMPGYHALFLIEPQKRYSKSFRGNLQLSPLTMVEIMTIVKLMYHESQSQKPGYKALLLSKLTELIVILSREYLNVSSTEAQPVINISKAISEIESKYYKQWTLDDICKIANISKSKLFSSFRDVVKQTPLEYLIHIRIQHAMELLKTTELTVSEISYKVGFSNNNYFSRQFKKIVGKTPSNYKQGL